MKSLKALISKSTISKYSNGNKLYFLLGYAGNSFGNYDNLGFANSSDHWGFMLLTESQLIYSLMHGTTTFQDTFYEDLKPREESELRKYIRTHTLEDIQKSPDFKEYNHKEIKNKFNI